MRRVVSSNSRGARPVFASQMSTFHHLPPWQAGLFLSQTEVQMRSLTLCALVLATAPTTYASLTLLSGPPVATHVGNLVVDGSFEDGPPGAVVYWATGTSHTPLIVPPGWTSSGMPINYAIWGHTNTSPLNIQNSAIIPDGVKALYF